MNPSIESLDSLDLGRFEHAAILKRLDTASRQLAELKGVAASIPNQAILVNTLGMQEAKDSSAIENIVTTHDELFRDAAFPEAIGTPAAKEVLRLPAGAPRRLRAGARHRGAHEQPHPARSRRNSSGTTPGFRRVPGTTLKDGAGRVVYTPPQDARAVRALMADLERFINDDRGPSVDPLVRMALIHHQFESIHPFYDGNGRTGRIMNVLYLVKEGLLETPVLYMSRHIVRTKARYYELLQAVRERDAWEEWVIYMLTAVEETARDGIATITAIKAALLDVKHRVRASASSFTARI